jgi:hypothetical protein
MREIEVTVEVEEDRADELVEDLQVAADEYEGITLRTASTSYAVEVADVKVVD